MEETYEHYVPFPEYAADQGRGSKTAADVARILHEAAVACLLWGWLAVGLAGYHYRQFPQVDFVIPDSHLDAAIEALTANGFTLCSNPNCSELQVDRCPEPEPQQLELPPEQIFWSVAEAASIMAFDRFHPVAKPHFHIGPAQDPYYNLLSLFSQSQLLWWLPDITLDDPSEDDDNFMLSDDPRFPEWWPTGPTGPWTELYYPIKALKTELLAEAVILLLCRDYCHVKLLDNCWLSMFHAMLGPDSNHKRLRSAELQLVWDTFQNRIDDMPVGKFRAVRRLRDDLIARNELPDIPEVDLEGSY